MIIETIIIIIVIIINDKGLEFLQELGRRMTEAMGDHSELIHLSQSLSV